MNENYRHVDLKDQEIKTLSSKLETLLSENQKLKSEIDKPNSKKPESAFTTLSKLGIFFSLLSLMTDIIVVFKFYKSKGFLFSFLLVAVFTLILIIRRPYKERKRDVDTR